MALVIVMAIRDLYLYKPLFRLPPAKNWNPQKILINLSISNYRIAVEAFSKVLFDGFFSIPAAGITELDSTALIPNPELG